MCEYAWMSAIGNYSLLATPAAIGVAAIWLLLVAIVVPDRRRAALLAASALAIPICIIPFAAVAAFMTLMGHQMRCPGLEFHGVSAILGVLALATAIGCPLAAWTAATAGATR